MALRDALTSLMTPDQIAEAKRNASEWVRSDVAAFCSTAAPRHQNFAVIGFGVVGASGDIENVNQTL